MKKSFISLITLRRIFLSVLIFLNLFALGCVYTPLNEPEPKSEINPLLGILIAQEVALAPFRLAYSTCEGAERINSTGFNRDIDIPRNEIVFFELSNFPAPTQVVTSIAFLDGSSSTNLCLFIGKENQRIDTNSPINSLDSPSSTATICPTRVSFIAPSGFGNFRCVGILNDSASRVRLRVDSMSNP